jgi:CubicO group peptidase (beta-lactamase class C family)
LPGPDSLTAELSRVVREAQAEHRLPSVSAAAVRDGEVVWEETVGLGDADRSEAATPDHQYRIASITKTVTAVGILQLRDEGKLNLEDRLTRHVPEAKHDPTIRGLLTHLSGIQREVPGEVWETLEMPTREELLPRLAEAEQVLAPGAFWHYSNLAFALLGEVLARGSGRSAEEYLDDRVLRPLGMARTTCNRRSPSATSSIRTPTPSVVKG